jgi:AcrR family transcriptional regulator
LSKRAGEFSESRERVLDAAEKLFMERGYDRVSMRDIAMLLGVQQAALYYHAPDGKSQLFMMVVERNMLRQREGLEQAIAAAPANIRSQMTAIAGWLVEHMPVDMIGMLRSDAAAVGLNGQELFGHVARGIMGPITGVVVAAQQRGEIRPMDPQALAGMLIATMNWTAFLSRHFPVTESADHMIERAISILLDGARP